MTTYTIIIKEDGNTETATFNVAPQENLFDVVLEVLSGLGFKPFLDKENQQVDFAYEPHTFWEDILYDSIGLWTLKRDFRTTEMILSTI